MRHGNALNNVKLDRERPLSDIGRSQVKSVFGKLGHVTFDAIYTSPFLRTRQTCEEVQECLPNSNINMIETDKLIPGNNINSMSTIITKDGSYLLISHMPLVSHLTGWLAKGDINEGIIFSTAMIAELELEAMLPGTAQIVRIVSP